MQSQPPDESTAGTPAAARRRRRRRIIIGALAIWAVAAYLIAPRAWELYLERTRPMADVQRVTKTSDGHPGDPLNLAIEGTDEQVVRAMTAAGWFPADPVTFASSIKIAVDTVFRRPDDQAPVSPLYLFERMQDLAFELPVPGGPKHRHHVRFWRWDQQRDGKPVWFGAATYDISAGLSHTTGQITHHIGPDVDAERALIVEGLTKAGWVGSVEWIDGFHKQLEGKNGGGDPWKTDGRLAVVKLETPR